MECKSDHGTFDYSRVEERPTPQLITLVEAWFLMAGYKPPFHCVVKSVTNGNDVGDRIELAGFGSQGHLVNLKTDVSQDVATDWKLEIMPAYEGSKQVDGAAGIGVALYQMITLRRIATMFCGNAEDAGMGGELYWLISGIFDRLKGQGFSEDKLDDVLAEDFFPSRVAALACFRCMAQLGYFVTLAPPLSAADTSTRYEWTSSFKKDIAEWAEDRRAELLNLQTMTGNDFLRLLTSEERDLFKRLEQATKDADDKTDTKSQDDKADAKSSKDRRLVKSKLGLHPAHLDWFVGYAKAATIVEVVKNPDDKVDNLATILGKVWRLNWDRYQEVLAELHELEKVEIQAAEVARLAELANRPTEDERIEEEIRYCLKSIARLPAAIERTEGKIVVLKQREQDLWEELRRNEQELRMAQSGRDEEQMGLDHSRTRLPELEQQRQLRQGLAEQEARKLMEDVKATAQTLLMKPDKLLVALQRLQEEAKKS